MDAEQRDAETPPSLVVLAGPSGAGKTTAALDLLVGAFGVAEFINADIIEKSLSETGPGKFALEAGRLTLERLGRLTSAPQLLSDLFAPGCGMGALR